MDTAELEKEKSHIIVEIIQYIPKKQLLRKLPETLPLLLSMPAKNWQKKPRLMIITSKLLTVRQKLPLTIKPTF